MNPFLLADAYKVSHPDQYPEGTEYVYSNTTARTSRMKGVNEVVVFGIQYLIRRYLVEEFNTNFFRRGRAEVISELETFHKTFFGKDFDASRYEALHALGYLPLRIKALPEGTRCPIGVPFMTIENTHPEFFWLTNFVETLTQTVIWNMITSATIADRFRRMLDKYAEETGDPEFVPFQGHNFSMRGMSSVESGTTTDMGHLLSFVGSDTLPGAYSLRKWYGSGDPYGFGDRDLVACSVPACFDSETEVLTHRGFKYFVDLDDDDLVAQYHEDGNIDFVEPVDYYVDEYSGDMVRFGGGAQEPIDALVTPNHRMVKNNKNKEGVATDGHAIEFFEAGESVTGRAYSYDFRVVVSGVKRDGADELTSEERLLIAFQADGSFSSRANRYTGIRTGTVAARFSLKKDRKAERLREIFSDLGIEYSESKYENGYYSFRAKVPITIRLSKCLDWIDLSSKSSAWGRSFIEELSHWDGYKTGGGDSVYYCSTDLFNVEQVQAVAAMCGMKTQYNRYVDKRGDRLPVHNINITERQFASVRDRLDSFLEGYSGNVYCVSVPTKMLMVRRKGKVYVSGNTEHCTVSAGGMQDERETFRRLIQDVYPTGIVSIVSDTWNYWKVLTEILPSLKEEILSREGRLTVRPDSGCPERIICGYRVKDVDVLPSTISQWMEINAADDNECDALRTIDGRVFDLHGRELSEPEIKGSIRLLDEVFGSTVNEKGYKVLNPKVGLIYGDAIYYERAETICKLLKEMGYASTNVVFGVGSWTYQYVTRDTFGIACKATWAQVNGVGRELFKDPVTDDGTKKSARGLLCVYRDSGGILRLKDQATRADEMVFTQLGTVFLDGDYRSWHYSDIRERLRCR